MRRRASVWSAVAAAGFGLVVCLGSPPSCAQALEPRSESSTGAPCAQPHACLSLSEEQVAASLEAGRKLFRDKKPHRDVFAGWRARKPKGKVDEVVWLSPAARYRELGYLAEQAAWDADRLAPKIEEAKWAIEQKTLVFRVYMRAQVSSGAMAFKNGMVIPTQREAPVYGATIVTLADDQGNRFSSVAERYEPVETNWEDRGLSGFRLPGGGYSASHDVDYTATYVVEFPQYSPEGLPRVTPTTKTLTVEFPELGDRATIEVPATWDGVGPSRHR